MSSYLMPTYRPLPIAFEYGKGAWLWDMQGKKYLDAMSGIAVCALGHAHPAITKTITEQAGKLLHTSNAFTIHYQEKLAEALVKAARMDQAFFCNTGAEANECAIKMARLYGHQQNFQVPTIVVMEGSFHGRTLGTLTASGSRKVQAGFEPLVQGFLRAPYNDLEALRTIAKNSHEVVAVMLEPVQGESGIIVPDKDYLQGVRKICDENNWLLILDEVQTGMGRTGQLFAHQHEGILPDIMTLAKALGNGVPIGACLGRGKAKDLFQPGKHGSTFGGNPLCCHTALTVLETLQKENLSANAAKQGQRLMAGFQQRLADQKQVKEIRGKGLMIGIELTRPCRDLLLKGLEKGVVLNVTGEDKVIRLLPPLILKDEEADLLVKVVSELVIEFGVG